MEKAGASSACLSQCDMMELCTDRAPKGERLNKIEDQLLTMKPGVKMEGFRTPASSGLSKTPSISSHLRILYKLPSQRLAKLGTFARLHKATPRKIFVERACTQKQKEQDWWGQQVGEGLGRGQKAGDHP